MTQRSRTSPSFHLPIVINENWRVVSEDHQWILQCRKGSPDSKSSGWRSRSFNRDSNALMASINRKCGGVSEEAIEAVAALPAWHP